MIGKQPPLQRFASMQDYLPDLDYAVHTMVCLTAANFCRRLPLFNLTYRRTISIRRNEEFLFLRPCPFTLPFTGKSSSYKSFRSFRDIPRVRTAKIHGGKASAGQPKRKRDYASPRHHRGNGGWKIRNGVNNYATTIIGERNYDYAPPHAVAANFLASPLLRRPSALPSARPRTRVRGEMGTEGGGESGGQERGK